ncbi:MAG TPA: hypothetical protein VGR68_11125 [Actinomycetota bacterium]|nr:hypothetical protein [Actinomycetota bacterium]
MQNLVREADRQRMVARARASHAGGRWALAGYRRLRQAAGFGLVRTGLRLLDARRA